MRKILPILLALIGTGAGVGAGIFLKPEAEMEHAENPCGDAVESKTVSKEPTQEEEPTTEYVKMSNQFVIPVVAGDRVRSLVVLSLSVEIPLGQSEAVFSREPKLRDAFLQALFDHANLGGFNGAFTRANTLDVLRQSLREAAAKVLGESVMDVLITEIARQDV